MPAVNFSIDGDKELIKALERAAKSLRSEQVRQVIVDAARAIRADAASRIRDKTGNLRRALFVYDAPRPDANLLSVLAGVSPKRAPHRHLVEYGHGGPRPAPPRPFWRPAVLTQWPVWRARILHAASEALRDA